MSPQTITAGDLLDRLAAPSGQWPVRDWALLDIRETGEAAAGHIPSATPLPRRLIEFRIRELVPDPGTPIVVYDSGTDTSFGADRRADLAARTLHDLGYRAVQALAGGVDGWRACGGHLARDANVPCKAFGERVLEQYRVPQIQASELDCYRRDGCDLVICDVRTTEEFVGHHLPGAISTPGFELVGRLPELETRYETIVVNCAGRTRSIIGAATARLMGVEGAVALENGTMGWRLAGFDVEQGPEPGGLVVDTSLNVRNRASELAFESGVKPVSAVQLDEAGSSKEPFFYVVDVRGLADYRAGHVPGAIALPGGQAVQRADDFIAVPGAPVVFVDDGDARAPLAAYWYRQMGFPDVSFLTGGMPAWTGAGLEKRTGRDFRCARSLDAIRSAADFRSPETAFDGAMPVVIDIRTSRDFAAGHIPEANWIPRGWLEAAVAVAAALDDPILLVAKQDEQALLASETLRKLGYREVRILNGGMAAWSKSGMQVDEGIDEKSPFLPDLLLPPYDKGLEEMQRYLDWEIRLQR